MGYAPAEHGFDDAVEAIPETFDRRDSMETVIVSPEAMHPSVEAEVGMPKQLRDAFDAFRAQYEAAHHRLPSNNTY